MVKKNGGFLHINAVILITLAVMVGYWLVTAPKVDIPKSLEDIKKLPKLTFQTLTSQEVSPQSSSINKEAAIDQKAVSKLSTQQIKNNQDLDKINQDLDKTEDDNLDSLINQIETEVE